MSEDQDSHRTAIRVTDERRVAVQAADSVLVALADPTRGWPQELDALKTRAEQPSV